MLCVHVWQLDHCVAEHLTSSCPLAHPDLLLAFSEPLVFLLPMTRPMLRPTRCAAGW